MQPRDSWMFGPPTRPNLPDQTLPGQDENPSEPYIHSMHSFFSEEAEKEVMLHIGRSRRNKAQRGFVIGHHH